jgi:hypothetical protein
MDISIKFRIEEDENIPAFAGFVKDSVNKGEAIFKVAIKATLLACAEHDIDFYEILSENCVHELLHAFQEYFHKTFNEKEIENAILQAREFLKDESN